MIRVVVEYKLKAGADIQPVFLKLRSYALTFPGFMAAENLMSEQDSSVAALVSTWETVEDWKEWERSKARQEVLREAEALLEEKPKVTIYRIRPTTRWVG
jgi:heme-degrading monooxygenase HmoA